MATFGSLLFEDLKYLHQNYVLPGWCFGSPGAMDDQCEIFSEAEYGQIHYPSFEKFQIGMDVRTRLFRAFVTGI